MSAVKAIVAHPPLLSTLHVLVIDDQPAALKIIKDMLLAMGVPVVVATTEPRKAVQMLDLRTRPLDAVLCDWRMPEMTGLDVLKEVRAACPDMPFLMVTGAADAASVLKAKEQGVSGYIRKPFSADELRRKLEAIARVKAHRGAAAPTIN